MSGWRGVETRAVGVRAPAPLKDSSLEFKKSKLVVTASKARADILMGEQTAKRAAAIFDMPAAMVSFIDEELQQVRGFHGELPAPEGSAEAPVRYADQLDMPRSHSICGHVVADNLPLVVPDVARDPRFATNPVLAAKGLRFYAGAPLRPKKGAAIGSLCLLDTQPREFGERDAKLLQAMADDLMHEVAERAEQPEVAPGAAPTPGRCL